MRRLHLIFVGLLGAGFALGASLIAPTTAVRAAEPTTYAVVFQDGSRSTPYESTAANVGQFLIERGIHVAPGDEVVPAPAAPLSNGATIIYRRAIHVTFLNGASVERLATTAQDVGSFLSMQGVKIGKFDKVFPSLGTTLHNGSRIRLFHIIAWDRSVLLPVRVGTIHRMDTHMRVGARKIVADGSIGERRVDYRYFKYPNGIVRRVALTSTTVHPARPRIVLDGVGDIGAFSNYTARSIGSMQLRAVHAISMVATAYTPWCTGCSGITATGERAGHGIVAVDPRVIPLGTKLYIPGYGYAIAGDTGGAIIGHRIDLGFDSQRAAMDFGRRKIVVFAIKG